MGISAAEPSEKECKETYKEIRSLLDKGVITIEQAQKMWYDWERKKHK